MNSLSRLEEVKREDAESLLNQHWTSLTHFFALAHEDYNGTVT